MVKYDIVEGVTPNGHHYFEIVENDDWKYPSLGIFKSRERAELKMAELNNPESWEPKHV